ncbi:hypothetical protein E1A91_A08G007100v1 [Gossypium mustelinum]|uniref:Uncharacterized protein n=1 Tax=Gossypium mustelinum TaxID=34275 RepID=A0A5D2Y330_GOSMU|nr:hypothetical protein E1A91_A08G007100v1 [Gossypium mustelinum]
MGDAPPTYLPYGNNTLEVCFPGEVNSAGIWENLSYPSVFLSYPLPRLELQILLTFLCSHFIYLIVKPLGITFFATQMLAGLLLGHTVLGKLDTVNELLFSQRSGIEIIDTTGLFGFVMFMFLMGVKMDLRVAFRSTKRATVIGFISILAPITVGLIIFEAFKKPEQSKEVNLERLLGTTIESLTSFSVIACLLSELNILNSELGRLALSASAIADVGTLVLVFIFSSMAKWAIAPSVAAVNTAGSIAFVVILFFVCRPVMFWVIKTTPDGKPIKEVYIMFIVMMAIGSSIFTHFFSDSPLIGAFVFGLAVPDGPPLGSALVDKLECFVNGVFLAVFTTTSTMRVDVKSMMENRSTFLFSIIFVCVTFLAKVISCFIATFWSLMPLKDSLAFALIMSSKGIVELSYFCSFIDNKIMSTATFSVLVLGILVNSTIVPVLVKLLYDPDSRRYAGYEKRTLMHLKPDSEIRVLACTHRSENVSTIIELLDLTCPTKESPQVVFALHIVELKGRDSPVFIAHQKNENSALSSLENIFAYNQYEQNNWDSVTVYAFTAISPPKLMHEDICTMALNKQTSFIILPFHRKFSTDGSVENENSMMRNVNCSVLDRAPCSVGILIDRGVDDRGKKTLKTSSRMPTCSIGMLFIGGKDDREALTLAKRMARDPQVNLTVIRLIADHHYSGNIMDWDGILDSEVLKDVKQKNEVGNSCNIMYAEEVSNDGPQAAGVIRSIVNNYDLIIVGRRYKVESVQTMGLAEWCEFPELGVVGDLLASTDLDSSVSVLVVQQQYYVELGRAR